MNALGDYVLRAFTLAAIGCAAGFIYGWLCGVVVSTPEKLERQRQIDRRLWWYLGPGLALSVLVALILQGKPWHQGVGYGVGAWVVTLAVRGGIDWSIRRRLARGGL